MINAAQPTTAPIGSTPPIWVRWGLPLGTLLILLAAAWLMLITAPGGLSRFLAAAQTDSLPHWALPVSAVGVALGGSAATLLVLVEITRAFTREPFVWSAPITAAAFAITMHGIEAELPFTGITTTHFTVVAGAILVIGGAILRLPGWASQLAGVCLCLSPLGMAFVGLAHRAGGVAAAVGALDETTFGWLGVTAVTSIGMLALGKIRMPGTAGAATRQGALAARSADPGFGNAMPLTAAKPGRTHGGFPHLMRGDLTEPTEELTLREMERVHPSTMGVLSAVLWACLWTAVLLGAMAAAYYYWWLPQQMPHEPRDVVITTEPLLD